MQARSSTQSCLLLLLLAVTMASSAVIPSETKTAVTTVTPPTTEAVEYTAPTIVPQLAGGHCLAHRDCFCSMGMGMCHEGRCYCVWGLRPEQMSVTEISALISEHPEKTPETTSQPKTTKAP